MEILISTKIVERGFITGMLVCLVSPFGELLLRRDVDLVLHAADLDDVTQIPRLSVDLYPLFEEGFLLDRTQ